MLQFFFITVYFYLSFVSNSLAYISIPKNKEKQKLTERKKTTATLRLPNLVSLKKLKKVGKASLQKAHVLKKNELQFLSILKDSEMTTILSLLFLKINVRSFSQSLTDDLAQFCHIISINYKRHLIDQVLYSQHYAQSDQNAVFTFHGFLIILLAVC